MLSLWYCVRYQHDWRLVALAGLICGLTCLAAVTLLRQQRGETPSIDRRWRLTAGVMTGFGIWSAHFVAMLGYNTGPVVVGYAYGPTALSLMVAIGVTIGGFMLPYVRKLSLPFLAAGGALVGAGIVAMHYIGMSAVEFPGQAMLTKHMVLIEDALNLNGTISGGGFSAADIQLTFYEELLEGFGQIAPYPNMQAHLAQMRQRDAYKRAEDKGGPVGLRSMFAALR